MKFRENVQKIVEDYKPVIPAKNFEGRIKGWYNAGINPNLVMDSNAMWYGMPRLLSGGKTIIDQDARFLIKKVDSLESESPNVIIQEVKKELVYPDEKNVITRWKIMPIGEPVAISSNDLMKILLLPKNKGILDHVLKNDTTHSRDINPDVWYKKYSDNYASERSELKKFADANDISSLETAERVKKALDDGYTMEWLRAFGLDAAPEKAKSVANNSDSRKALLNLLNTRVFYSDSEIANWENTIRATQDELRAARDYLEKAENLKTALESDPESQKYVNEDLVVLKKAPIGDKIKTEDLDDIYYISKTNPKLKNVPGLNLSMLTFLLKTDIANAENTLAEYQEKMKTAPETAIKNQKANTDEKVLKFWNMEDYADELKKYGIK